jgi:uncharacterized membrane protein
MNDLQTLPQTQANHSRQGSLPTACQRPRDRTIDTLRGLAIFTMIAANLAAPVLVEPHPYWLRLYGSFAAPLFVVLSGMMVAYGTQNGHTLRHYLVRGAVLVAIASLLDAFVWHDFPLLSMDVLYLLGISLPVAYVCVKLNSRARWLIIGTIVLCTPLLQHTLGYADFPKEVTFARGSRMALAPSDFLHHWLIDGWFPLFPWLGFTVFGVQVAGLRPAPSSATRHGESPGLYRIGPAVLGMGGVLWYAFPGPFLVRAGYSELFYPPTPGFVVTAAGVFLTLLGVIDRTNDLPVYRPLERLGKSALTIYVAHLLLIHFAISHFAEDVHLAGFALLYAGLIVIMLGLAHAEQVLETQWRTAGIRSRPS